jgi:vacuolar-type H+-ATPase subunit H
MKIDEFEKLEKKINKQNFHESYKTLKLVMVALSYFGHVASIFLAFFMLSNILLGVMDNKPVVYVVTVIVLSAIELLKRDIFHKFSILYLKLRSFTKDVLPLFFLSITIIGISFYSSIKGASEYSSKSDKIEKDSEKIIKRSQDSIKGIYDTRINDKVNEISLLEKDVNSLRSQQRQLNDLALTGSLTKEQKRLLSLLPKQISEAEKQNKDVISGKKDELEKLKSDLTNETDKVVKKIKGDVFKQKKDNSKNSIAFIIFSTIIEISILAGVYFKDYYDVRSHREKKNELEKDGSYQKWRVYKQILEIIYTEDTKVNQKLPSGKGIIDNCKVNDVIILPKDITNFLKTMTSLGIIKVSGSTRYFAKERSLAFDALNKHFNIE